MSIKSDPELRHVLAHVFCAIDYLCFGRPRLALAELDSVRGLVNFTSERAYQKFYNQGPKAMAKKKGKGKKKGMKCHY